MGAGSLTAAAPGLALGVEPRRLEAPARHFPHEIARLHEAADEDAGHLLEEASGIARVGVDELIDAHAVQGEKRRLDVGLDGGSALGLVAENTHLSDDSP